MNDIELRTKVHSAMYNLIKSKGIASPVEVLIEIGVLSKEDYERWRFGKVPYLEKVCKINLAKLSKINREIRAYAAKNELKPSWTFYRKFGTTEKGKGKSVKLLFSKTGNESIEKLYATHYLKKKVIDEVK